MPALPDSLARALQEEAAAARWVRCALQVNPYAYVVDQARVRDRWESAAAYDRDLVAALQAHGVGVIGLADHHRFDDSAESLRTVAEAAGITVFPGFEYTTADNTHYVCLFEPGTARDELQQHLGKLGAPAPGRSIGGRSSVELPGLVARLGGVAVAAHVDVENGLLHRLNGDATVAAWTSPDLLAVAVSAPTLRGERPIRGNPADNAGAREVLKILRNKNDQYARPAVDPLDGFAIAVLHAGDLQDPEQLGRGAPVSCWLKLGELTVHGLRCAFAEHGLRVRREPPRRDDGGAILAIGWEGGGFLAGQHLALSEDFTALIGGRGSGKSMVVESLRFALALPLHAREDERRVFEERIGSQLGKVLGEGSRVYVLLRRKSGDEVRRYVLSRAVGRRGNHPPPNLHRVEGDQLVPADDLDLATLVPGIVLLGQGEGSALARDAAGLTAHLERFRARGDDASSRATRRAQVLEALRLNRQSWVAEQRRSDQAAEVAAKAPSYREQLEEYRTGGLEALLAEGDQLGRADGVIESSRAQVAAVAEVAEGLGALVVEQHHLAAERLAETGIASVLDPLHRTLDQLQAAVADAAHRLSDGVALAQADLDGVAEQVAARHVALEQRIAEASRDLPPGRSSLAGLEGLREDLRRAEKAEALHDAAQQRIRELRAERDDLVAELEGNCAAEAKALGRAGSNLVKALGSGRGDGRAWLRVQVAARRSAARAGELLGRARGLGDGTVGGLLSSKDFDPVVLGRAIAAGAEALRAPPWSLPEAKARDLAALSLDDCLALAEVPPVFETSIELDIAWGDEHAVYRPLAELSVGQRATALLLLLLADPKGQGPLIIDQPEDDLDNRYVYEHLVNRVAACKGFRQLVFATHNANLPVLGDAELVVPLATEFENGEVRGIIQHPRAGPVDAARTRPLVEQLLEGSRDAFKRRGHRYDLRVEETT